MSVTLVETGLFALLDSPAGQVSRYVTVKAEAVAEIARNNVRSNFHTRTGNLERSIGIFPTETPDGLDVEVGTGGQMAVSVGTEGSVNYGLVLELGGEPHLITPINANILSSWQDENHPDPLRQDQHYVMHPGPTAKPWLRPALEQVFGA